MAQEVLGTSLPQLMQRLNFHGGAVAAALQVGLRHRVEQFLRLRQVGRCARDGGARRRKLPLEQRDRLASKKIALADSVGVALILDPLEAPQAGVGLDLRARDLEQRPQQPGARTRKRPKGRHRSKAAQARAAQQPQQQGFGLVIAMLRKNDEIGLQASEHFLARLPRGALNAETAVGAQVHGFQLQRNL